MPAKNLSKTSQAQFDERLVGISGSTSSNYAEPSVMTSSASVQKTVISQRKALMGTETFK